MTGGINIYSVERGYVIGPYSAAYLWVDIEGFDLSEGIKGLVDAGGDPMARNRRLQRR